MGKPAANGGNICNEQGEAVDCSVLRATTVWELLKLKERKQVIEVPFAASVLDTMRTLHRHHISAVPVTAPPNYCLSAAHDDFLSPRKPHKLLPPTTTAAPACKHYIGIVSNLDILMHLAQLGRDNTDDLLPRLLNSPVRTIIGSSTKGSNLQTMNPDTSVLEAMDMLSEGIHKVLIPLERVNANVIINGMTQTSCSSCYGMLTQTDVAHFLRSQAQKLQPVMSQSIESLGVLKNQVLGVPGMTPFCDTLKCMREASLTTVAILELTEEELSPLCQPQLVLGFRKRYVGTFSASDLTACPTEALKRWGGDSILHFLKRLNVATKLQMLDDVVESEELKFQVDWMAIFCRFESVVCCKQSSLKDAINLALDNKVHRVWVLEQDCLLAGIISLTDILRVVRCYCCRETV